MKILIVMGGFFPGRKYGGPPVSADNFCTLLKDCVECYIVTCNHDMGEDMPYQNIITGWNDRGNVKVMYLSDHEYNSKSFEKVINEVKPTYIYLQGLFQESVYPCLRLAKKHRITVVLAPRGELCSGAFKKKYKKLPYIFLLRTMGLLNNVIFQSTSTEESDAIHHYLGVSHNRIHLMTNIPSIPHDLRDHRKKNAGEGHFVFISRILWKKNLLSAIQYLSSVNGTAFFDIYGPKEDESYWRDCEYAISQLPSNVIVTYKGVLSHDEIHNTFCQYDAFLFPTLSENYGHVIAEALLTGCIPIISNQTPWNDINNNGAGWAIPLEDEEMYKKVVQDVVDMNESDINKKRESIKKYLNEKLKMDELKKEYLNVFK